MTIDKTVGGLGTAPPMEGDSPEDFNAKSVKTLNALPTLITDINAVTAQINTTAEDINTAQSAINTSIANGKSDINTSIASGKSDINTSIADGKSDINTSITDGKADITASIAEAKATFSADKAEVAANKEITAGLKADVAALKAAIEQVAATQGAAPFDGQAAYRYPRLVIGNDFNIYMCRAIDNDIIGDDPVSGSNNWHNLTPRTEAIEREILIIKGLMAYEAHKGF